MRLGKQPKHKTQNKRIGDDEVKVNQLLKTLTSDQHQTRRDEN